MPELPEMQALAERLDVAFDHAHFSKIDALSFSGLKTVRPSPQDLAGLEVVSVGRRGKYLVIGVEGGLRVLIHLSQAGRLDIESPPKVTKPRGAVVRIAFDNGSSILVREYGHERKAGWWVLAAGDEGPLATLGPEADSADFVALILQGADTRHLHTMLRDQHFVAGLGRGHTDDVLHAAELSPFSSLRALDLAERERLIDAVQSVLAAALSLERTRVGGLSEAKLGGRFLIHNHAGDPCPRCGERLARISYDSYEIVYCPICQTNGKVLADRRLSRLVR